MTPGLNDKLSTQPQHCTSTTCTVY